MHAKEFNVHVGNRARKRADVNVENKNISLCERNARNYN